jgi:hypothetical protein
MWAELAVPHRVDGRWTLSYKGPVTLQIAACPNHPQREAIGICVECRRRVCSECATKVDGINYCVGCLASLAKSQAPGAVGRPRQLAAYVSAGAYFVVLTGLFWVLLEVMLPPGMRR